MTGIQPRYPVYIPSRDRSHACQTARCFLRDGTPFYLVVEPAQEDSYRQEFPTANLLVTPRDNMRLLGARNWIRDHSEALGAERHWQIDDNVQCFYRLHRGERIRANASLALRVCEDFTDRYTNVGISGLNYTMFVTKDTSIPYLLNCHVYSISLISNRMPYRWRLVYNDDTDLCLQVLAGGLCTIALNTFNAQKLPTMKVQGGNTNQLYEGDGRLKMARMLERQWPGVVTTRRRYGRAQHVINKNWRAFDNPLIRRTDIDWENLPQIDDYGVTLVASAPIESPKLQRFFNEYPTTATTYNNPDGTQLIAEAATRTANSSTD